MSGTEKAFCIDSNRFFETGINTEMWENAYGGNPLPFVLLEARFTNSDINSFAVIYSNNAFHGIVGDKYDFASRADFLSLCRTAVLGEAADFVINIPSTKKVCMMHIFSAGYGRVAGIISVSEESGKDELVKKLSETNDRLASSAAAARLNAQRFRTVSSTVLDILVDLDYERNKCEVLIAKNIDFLIPTERGTFAAKEFYKPLVFPDDLPAFIGVMIDAAEKGITKVIDVRARVYSNSPEYRWFSVTVSAIKYGETITHMLFALSDVDAKHREAEMMKQLAEHDPLSGLLNKSTMTEKTAKLMMTVADDEEFAFLIIDIDDFKAFNDGFGHLAGDGVISDVSRILKNTFIRGDLVGRVGGDEFTVLMRSISGEQDVLDKFKSIAERLSLIARERGYSSINISMGAAISSASNRKNYHVIFNEADVALYQAKNEGKNCCVIYDEGRNGETA